MEDQEFTELLSAVDELTFEWDHEYSLAFEKILTDNEKRLKESQKKLLRLDTSLFRLRIINPLHESGKSRFMPLVEYTDGTVFPNPEEFDKAALDYLRARVPAINNPAMKARYLDFLWEYGGKENKYETGKQLVAAYLDAFSSYTFDNEMDKLDSLYRAIFIATRLEKKMPSELTHAAISQLERYLKELRESKEFRWILDAIEIVVRQIDHFDSIALKMYSHYIEDGIQHYSTKDYNFTILEAFYDLKFRLLRFIDPKSYSAKALAADKAQNYVKEARNRTDSAFVQQHFYSLAAGIYKNAGMIKESDQMVAEIAKIGQAEDFNNQFKKLSHEVVITNEELDKLRAVLGTGNDVPFAMGLSANFVPSWAAAVNLSRELDGQFIAHKLFKTTYIGDKGYPTGSSANDPDSWIKEQYRTQASLGHALLARFLKEKIDGKEVHFSNFDKLFKKLKDIDEPTYDTVRHGLIRFFKNDYLSANMILTTQFEDTLRLLMPLFGLSPTMMHPTESKVYTEKTLNRILSDCRPMLGENMYRLFEYVLVDRSAYYLRHKDAHGFIKLSDNNYLYCVLILQLYCYLLASLRQYKRTTKGVKSK